VLALHAHGARNGHGRPAKGSGGAVALDDALAAAGIDAPAALVRIVTKVAHAAGVPRPCVALRAGRIELSLTDAADSMRWLLQWIVRYRDYDAREVLVVGDDFAVAGDAHTSRRLLIPELHGATVASVGTGADNAPSRVRRIGGGPEGVLELLDEQITLREARVLESFPAPSVDPDWLFQVEGFDPFREREVETWLTIANGETGTRGSLEEGSPASTPATFVAGVYGDDTGELHIRQPVVAPDWLCLRLLVEGMPLTLTNGEVIEHRRVLDMQQGVVFRYWRQRDRVGRTTRIRTVRFASLADRSIMVLRAEASPEDFCGRLVWEACVGVSHAGGPVYEASFTSLDGSGFVARTRGRKGGGHVMAVSTKPASGSPVARYLERSRDVIGGVLDCDEPATIDRIAAVVSSPSRPPTETSALQALERAERAGFDELMSRHREAWRARWADAAVTIEGDPPAQLALRFSLFHMIATAHSTRDTVSVGARGLAGMSYFNHVFWDTEIFVVPFFIYTHPETARTLLTYRYRNLDGARAKARDLGHKGALFPWESADKGVETTPPYGIGPHREIIPILSGLMEHHISADVAWATWEYWKGTGDDEFLEHMGVELLLETARFWVSRASSDGQGRFHIPMVVGPDEYHEGVDDNAFTNVMAQFNIWRALDAWEWLTARDPGKAAALGERLGFAEEERANWRRVSDALITGYDPATKLYEQFAGFYEMDDVDPASLAARPLAADLLLGRDVTLKSKVIKQADVVMLCHVLGDEIPRDVALANLRYYEPITTHGSSLSPGIHAALAARLGQMSVAIEAFRMASEIDLSDNMGNAARGLHMATMGALWQATVMGFGGIRRRDEQLLVEPHLPEEWASLSIALRFRGARLRFVIRHERLDVTVRDAAATLVVGRRKRRLKPGVHHFRRRAGGVWEKKER
jgi:trehalose/maltose hydrolase-like predicted phosphorylase